MCLFASALLFVGIALAFLGWQGWGSGEILIHSKGKQPFLRATGPASATFHIEVWTFMLLGGSAIALSVASVLPLVLTSAQRREQILLRLALQTPGARGPSVPGWAIAVVLLLFLGFLVCVASRGA